jgi:hypothetical protein
MNCILDNLVQSGEHRIAVWLRDSSPEAFPSANLRSMELDRR